MTSHCFLLSPSVCCVPSRVDLISTGWEFFFMCCAFPKFWVESLGYDICICLLGFEIENLNVWFVPKSIVLLSPLIVEKNKRKKINDKQRSSRKVIKKERENRGVYQSWPKYYTVTVRSMAQFTLHHIQHFPFQLNKSCMIQLVSSSFWVILVLNNLF